MITTISIITVVLTLGILYSTITKNNSMWEQTANFMKEQIKIEER